MMGWGRDQSNARCGVTNSSYPFIYFMTRKLAAFTGLCALCHFDLKLFRIREIIARNAKSPGGNLLDRGVFPITIFFFMKANFIFTTFATVALAANSVHGNGQCAVCLIGNRTERHCTGSEAFEYILCWFYFRQRNGFSTFEF